MKKYINYILPILIISVGLQIVSSCSPPKTIEKKTLLHKVVLDNEDTITGAPKYTDNAHGGKYYSHTDSLNAFGAGNLYSIPDSLLNKDIRVNINIWVRQGDFNDENQMAISLEEGSNIIQWGGISFVKHISETKKWVNVIDSFTFPASLINKKGLVIKVFPYNPSGTSYMDVDDAELLIYKVDKIPLQ